MHYIYFYSPITTMLRTIFAACDSYLYTVMSYLYQVFFGIVGTDFLSGTFVSSIYYRIQLIIGVFMIFKLAVTILQGIMNPDTVLDKKAGMGNIISRIIVSLIMLSLMAPISIPGPSNDFERQINNNGILFGTLFSLQNRILNNNTLGRIILGTSDDANNMTSSNELKETGNFFAISILKTFVRIGVLPSSLNNSNGKDPGLNPSNRVCPNLDDSILKVYNDPKSTPSQILSLVNAGCDDTASNPNLFFALNSELKHKLGFSGAQYAFNYNYIFSSIIAIVINWILIAYCIDVAIRVFKLCILRLIAPVPIISHMSISGKESKGNDSFSLWIKSLTTTYLELFIRLAIIFIVLYILKNILINGVNFTHSTNNNFIINSFVLIFIILGLMIFAKNAPAFIRNALGFSGTNSSIGLSAIMGMGGALANGGDLNAAAAAGINSINNTMNANMQGKQAPFAWSTGADLAEQIKTGDSKAKGGFYNRLNDYFMRQAGINSAKKYGVTANGLKIAKNRYLDLELEAGQSEQLYERYKNGNLPDSMVLNYAKDHNLSYNGVVSPNKKRAIILQAMKSDYNDYINQKGVYENTSGIVGVNPVNTNIANDKLNLIHNFENGMLSDQDVNKYVIDHNIDLSSPPSDSEREEILSYMYSDYNAKSAAASKAKSNYEDGKKFADSHRVNPSFEEEHRPSIRENLNFGDEPFERGDYVAKSRRRTGFQNIFDRILSSPDDWRKPLGEDNRRTDNRWNSSKDDNTENNAIHDDSNTNTQTPGSN